MSDRETPVVAFEMQVQRAGALLGRVRDEIARRVVGQADMVDGMLMGILTGGHVLLEGVPGLAKTLAIKSLSEVVAAEFRRIQFTPDLLPADLTGTMVFQPQSGEFLPRRGPVFGNIVLADEINRAPAKVQSALLEAMEERQVTIGDRTYPLPEPFFVLATQNPIEQEGTYPLPEAQLDRFVLKLRIDYPSPDEELEILRRSRDGEVKLDRILSPADIERLRTTVNRIAVDQRIEEYIVALVGASRRRERNISGYGRYIEYGASPRASINIYRCARARALMEGRSYVVPEDVKAVALPVLRHRIVLSYEAESEELSSDEVVSQLLSVVAVP